VTVFAFPNPTNGQCGLTLREYFACQALIGLIPIYTSQKSEFENLDLEYELIATEAFALADQMIKIAGDPS
jgi:hypothetical protein